MGFLDDLKRQADPAGALQNTDTGIPDRQALDGPRLRNFCADARRLKLRGHEAFDHVALRWRLASGTPLSFVMNSLPDIEQLESRLRRSAAQFSREAVRNPVTAKLQELRCELVTDFEARVFVTPDPDAGRVRFEGVHLDGFETLALDFASFGPGSGRPDELACGIVGEPNAFVRGDPHLRAPGSPGGAPGTRLPVPPAERVHGPPRASAGPLRGPWQPGAGPCLPAVDTAPLKSFPDSRASCKARQTPMPLFWKAYTSDVTSFIDQLKAAKPTLEEEQRKGRALLWDKRIDRDAQADYSEAKVAQQPYVYQTGH